MTLPSASASRARRARRAVTIAISDMANTPFSKINTVRKRISMGDPRPDGRLLRIETGAAA
ncbi:MAG: hypothetical protein M0Z73_01760 [Betaproteobacteria bacterium]|nr:hypothetical protein [Betaproteobacteria bacterium]